MFVESVYTINANNKIDNKSRITAKIFIYLGKASSFLLREHKEYFMVYKKRRELEE